MVSVSSQGLKGGGKTVMKRSSIDPQIKCPLSHYRAQTIGIMNQHKSCQLRFFHPINNV